MSPETSLLTPEQLSELRRLLDQSEVLHHKIMAKMSDARFDLLAAWEQKERLDLAIGRLIRGSTEK